MSGINLDSSGDIHVLNTPNGNYYLGYGAGNSNGGFNLINFKDDTYTPLITGLDSGNVGIGTYTPAYKLDVAGVAHASDRIWSDVSIGAKTTDTEGFRFEWDSNNNAVVVLRANGTPCNFYSMGGVSALGVGAAGATPSISAMKIASLTATTATAATLNVSTIKPMGSEIDILTPGQDGSYVAFNYEQRDGHYMTNFANVGIFGDDGSDETWSIDTDGSAVFAESRLFWFVCLKDILERNVPSSGDCWYYI